MKTSLYYFMLCFFVTNMAFAEPSFNLIGKGSYTFLFMDVYEAKLWATNSKDIYSGKLNLELNYKMNFEGLDIVKQTKKEFISTGVSDSNSEKWSKTLESIFPDVNKGDRLLASYEPKDGIKFYLNEKKYLGQVKDLEHSKSFLEIWLGSNSSDLDLRNKLLGFSNE